MIIGKIIRTEIHLIHSVRSQKIMPAKKLFLKTNATRSRGQHRCGSCHQDKKTVAGLKLHIANTPACRAKWEQDLMRRSPEPSAQAETPPLQTPEDDLDITMNNSFDETTFVPSERRPPSPGSDSGPQSKRARVEEVDDEDSCQRWAHEFPGAAAEILGEGKTLFEQMKDNQEAMKDPPTAPFLDEDEWELARWLMKNVTQTATEEFLKMKGVSYHYN